MIETILKEIKALLDARASLPVLHERLELLRAQIEHLQAENKHIKSQLDEVKQKYHDANLKLNRFTQTNPDGWHCNHCGSVDMVQTGRRPSPGPFGVMGLNEAIMSCTMCQHESFFELPMP